MIPIFFTAGSFKGEAGDRDGPKTNGAGETGPILKHFPRSAGFWGLPFRCNFVRTKRTKRTQSTEEAAESPISGKSGLLTRRVRHKIVRDKRDKRGKSPFGSLLRRSFLYKSHAF
jgi:hypothetical protein